MSPSPEDERSAALARVVSKLGARSSELDDGVIIEELLAESFSELSSPDAAAELITLNNFHEGPTLSPGEGVAYRPDVMRDAPLGVLAGESRARARAFWEKQLAEDLASLTRDLQLDGLVGSVPLIVVHPTPMQHALRSLSGVPAVDPDDSAPDETEIAVCGLSVVSARKSRP